MRLRSSWTPGRRKNLPKRPSSSLKPYWIRNQRLMNQLKPRILTNCISKINSKIKPIRRIRQIEMQVMRKIRIKSPKTKEHQKIVTLRAAKAMAQKSGWITIKARVSQDYWTRNNSKSLRKQPPNSPTRKRNTAKGRKPYTLKR